MNLIKNGKVMNVTLTEDIYNKLDKYSQISGQPKTAVVRMLIIRFIDGAKI